MVKLKPRTEITRAAEVAFSSSEGAESAPKNMLREQARRALGVALTVAERSVEHLIPPNAGLGRNLQVSGMPSYPVAHLCPPTPFTAPVAVVGHGAGMPVRPGPPPTVPRPFFSGATLSMPHHPGVEVSLQRLRRHRRLNPGTQSAAPFSFTRPTSIPSPS